MTLDDLEGQRSFIQNDLDNMKLVLKLFTINRGNYMTLRKYDLSNDP